LLLQALPSFEPSNRTHAHAHHFFEFKADFCIYQSKTKKRGSSEELILAVVGVDSPGKQDICMHSINSISCGEVRSRLMDGEAINHVNVLNV
jgi:hypothetical protein